MIHPCYCPCCRTAPVEDEGMPCAGCAGAMGAVLRGRPAAGAPVFGAGSMMQLRAESKLGGGAHGEVWLVRDPVSGADLAVKVLRAPEGDGDGERDAKLR